MTIWAALANFEESEKGSLEIGKSGDMVVFKHRNFKPAGKRYFKY
ncbi:MAG: hypothetical protein ACJ0QS_04140 [Parvicellaceae bacterium]